MALTLSQDDLDAIAALIDARIPADFNTLIITDGLPGGIAGPVVAQNATGDALASQDSITALSAKVDLIKRLSVRT